MNVKVDMGNGRVFTCEQLASALTLVNCSHDFETKGNAR